MESYRGREFTAKALGRMEARGEIAGLIVSHGINPCVLVLPLEQWQDSVAKVYGPLAIPCSDRVNTGPTSKGLNDRVLLDIVTNQVDKRGNVGGGKIYILTLWGDDCAALVPASPFWMARVTGEGEGEE